MKAQLLLAIATILFLFSCSGSDSRVNNPHSGKQSDHGAMHSSPNAAAAPYDLQFLDTMMAHHNGAVDMAVGTEKQAAHPEIVTLAKNIHETQDAEIEKMAAWRQEWFPNAAPAVNMELPGMMDSMMGMDMSKLDSLNGAAFDLEFIRQMIPHHEGGVIMARDALSKATRAEIKLLASSIISAQETEIKQMRQWQQSWKEN